MKEETRICSSFYTITGHYNIYSITAVSAIFFKHIFISNRNKEFAVKNYFGNFRDEILKIYLVSICIFSLTINIYNVCKTVNNDDQRQNFLIF